MFKKTNLQSSSSEKKMHILKIQRWQLFKLFTSGCGECYAHCIRDSKRISLPGALLDFMPMWNWIRDSHMGIFSTHMGIILFLFLGNGTHMGINIANNIHMGIISYVNLCMFTHMGIKEKIDFPQTEVQFS